MALTLLELAMKLRPYIEKAAQSLKDEDALEAVQLYPKWKAGEYYEKDYRLQHNNILYNVITTHTSQADWTPDVAPSLFAKVLIPDENTIYPWEQPDSTNGYKIGDIVSHNGKIWISMCNANVWEPGAIGVDETIWKEYTES